MTIQLYELVGKDDRRFSPYCWRARMALEHKGLDYETVPVRFTDKDLIAFSGQERIPVVRDGDNVVSDSWDIAEYLERQYPDKASLFGGGVSRMPTCETCSFPPRLLQSAYMMSCGETKLTTRSQGLPSSFKRCAFVRSHLTAEAPV